MGGTFLSESAYKGRMRSLNQRAVLLNLLKTTITNGVPRRQELRPWLALTGPKHDHEGRIPEGALPRDDGLGISMMPVANFGIWPVHAAP